MVAASLAAGFLLLLAAALTEPACARKRRTPIISATTISPSELPIASMGTPVGLLVQNTVRTNDLYMTWRGMRAQHGG
jgi:hypothetical protein